MLLLLPQDLEKPRGESAHWCLILSLPTPPQTFTKTLNTLAQTPMSGDLDRFQMPDSIPTPQKGWRCQPLGRR